MILEHVAEILLFSGPLLYLGLWMAIDPAGVEWLAEFVVRVSRIIVRGLGGRSCEGFVERLAISRGRMRIAGAVLVLFAVVV
jgi:hypothetical protein